MEGGKYSVEKREKIEEMYFIQKMSLTNIAEKLNVSVSYVSRLLRQNKKYHEEQEIRKQENQLKRKKKQKELIYSQRKEKARQRLEVSFGGVLLTFLVENLILLGKSIFLGDN